METVKVKFKKQHEDVIIPFYHHDGDSGMDAYAYIEDRNPIIIKSGETKLVNLGFSVAIPNGYEIQVRSTSGNSLKKNLVVNNSPGTVDAPYRGVLGVILHNEGGNGKEIVISHGDKVAQLVLCPVLKCEWNLVDELDSTTRGDGGYGSTEKNIDFIKTADIISKNM